MKLWEKRFEEYLSKIGDLTEGQISLAEQFFEAGYFQGIRDVKKALKRNLNPEFITKDHIFYIEIEQLLDKEVE